MLEEAPIEDESAQVSDEEGLSDEDLHRFSGDTMTCSACGAEMYDDGAACASCGHWDESGKSSSRLGVWVMVVIVLLIVISFVLF